MTMRVAAILGKIAVLPVLILSAPLYAQSLDGTYRGSIACEPIPGVTSIALKTLFTLRVQGDKVEYEREVLRPTGEAPLGITERGTGHMDNDGRVTLTGTARGRTFSSEASYKGTITAQSVRLTGTQIWTYMDKAAPHHRPCTIDLTRQG